MNPMIAIFAALSVSLSLLSAGCGEGNSAGSNGSARQLPSFHEWATNLAANPTTDVLLTDPDRWFAEHFPPELASRLASDYEAEARAQVGEEGLRAFFRSARDKGLTRVSSKAFTRAIDMDANGLQNAALQRASRPLTLYTIRLAAPGEETGMTLWSFAEDNGTYRFIGKLKPLKPREGELIMDVLSELPLGTAETLLKEKGALSGSVVGYLQDEGMLQ